MAEPSASSSSHPTPSTSAPKVDTIKQGEQNLYENLAVASATIPPPSLISDNVSRVLIIYTGGTIGMAHSENGYIPVPEFLTQTLASMSRFHDPAGQSIAKKAAGTPILSTVSSSSAIPPSLVEYTSLTNPVNIALTYPDQSSSSLAPLLAPANLNPNNDASYFVINGTPVMRTLKPALITPPSLYGKRIRYSVLEYSPLLDSANMTMTDWIKIATDIEVNYSLFDSFLICHGTDTMAYTASALSFMLENLGKTVIITGSQVIKFLMESFFLSVIAICFYLLFLLLN